MMSKDVTPVAEGVEVTQADRIAASKILISRQAEQDALDGKIDGNPIIRSFARHRLAAYEAGRAEGVREAAEVADALKYRAEHIALERYNAGEDMDDAVAASLIYGKAADAIRALSKEPTK